MKIYKSYTQIRAAAIKRKKNICYMMALEYTGGNGAREHFVSIPEMSVEKVRKQAIRKLRLKPQNLTAVYVCDIDEKGNWNRSDYLHGIFRWKN